MSDKNHSDAVEPYPSSTTQGDQDSVPPQQSAARPDTPEENAHVSAPQLAAEPAPQERLAAIEAAQNPLLDAAQPLLRALADMPSELELRLVPTLKAMLAREITSFQLLCNQANIRNEHAVAASYALCTALDESANGTAWGGAQGNDVGIWAAKPLAERFHGDVAGGEKFFLLIGRLASSAQEHTDLIEVLYMILGLGFEGRFRTEANGRHQLDTIRHRLLSLLNAARSPVPTELSPHWRGEGVGKFRLLRSVPVWVTASLFLLALLGIFAWDKYRLLTQSAEVEQGIAAIGKLRPPPAPPAKALRLKELLSAEIARGSVSVDEDAQHSAVRFKGDDMFVPGQARLSKKIDPVLAKVADEINQVSGTVQVTGHSDNQPIKTREFPDNQTLSEKRAAAVAQVLQSKGVVASRLQVSGKGDTMPIADNTTAAGRSKNRRVEMVVTQGVSVAPSATPTATPASGVLPQPASAATAR